jgi:hypothetical protein
MVASRLPINYDSHEINPVEGGWLSTRQKDPVHSLVEDWYTTAEVAGTYGVEPAAVLRMIRRGRLPASKLGWVWVVHKDDMPSRWPPPNNA